jgi:hypothetical protein
VRPEDVMIVVTTTEADAGSFSSGEPHSMGAR